MAGLGRVEKRLEGLGRSRTLFCQAELFEEKKRETRGEEEVCRRWWKRSKRVGEGFTRLSKRRKEDGVLLAVVLFVRYFVFAVCWSCLSLEETLSKSLPVIHSVLLTYPMRVALN